MVYTHFFFRKLLNCDSRTSHGFHRAIILQVHLVIDYLGAFRSLRELLYNFVFFERPRETYWQCLNLITYVVIFSNYYILAKIRPVRLKARTLRILLNNFGRLLRPS